MESMLISCERRFLFIHIDKAAGTSIQRALEPFAEPRGDSRLRRRLIWLGKLSRMRGLHRMLEFPEHVTANTVENCLPRDLYSRLFKFAFVRNPWDRLVSRYAYLLRNENHPRHYFVKCMKGFEDYVEWEISRGKMFQHTYVCDANGKMIVDFVGRFEQLHEDFAKICERLNIQAALPQVNQSSHHDYRSYYTSALRKRVGEQLQRDVHLFGYQFDGLCSKNILCGKSD